MFYAFRIKIFVCATIKHNWIFFAHNLSCGLHNFYEIELIQPSISTIFSPLDKYFWWLLIGQDLSVSFIVSDWLITLPFSLTVYKSIHFTSSPLHLWRWRQQDYLKLILIMSLRFRKVCCMKICSCKFWTLLINLSWKPWNLEVVCVCSVCDYWVKNLRHCTYK